MPEWSLVGHRHVLAAIEEYDRLGSKDFLARYGFRKARVYSLWHRGNEYDSKAILGAAYLHATGRAATWDEFSGGELGAAKVLVELGFDVVAEQRPAASARSKTPTPRRTGKPEQVIKICPRCQMALPATGVCDFCG